MYDKQPDLSLVSPLIMLKIQVEMFTSSCHKVSPILSPKQSVVNLSIQPIFVTYRVPDAVLAVKTLGADSRLASAAGL